MLEKVSDEGDDIFQKVLYDVKDILEKVSDDGDDIFEKVSNWWQRHTCRVCTL